jgi:GNAT superfamily N-acetyltransferase
MDQKSAQLPTQVHLESIAELIQSALDEAICFRMVQTGLAPGNFSYCYCWERDATKPLRHRQHYMKLTQLQVKFFPDARVVNLDLLCIPEDERGKGIGKKIVGYLFALIEELGYSKILLHTIKASETFWLKYSFVPVSATSILYPKRMVCAL